jgi:hypothetical protein
MSSVSDSLNDFMVLDAISIGMKSVDKLAKATKLNKVLVGLVVNDFFSQNRLVIAEKKGFLDGKKARNND